MAAENFNLRILWTAPITVNHPDDWTANGLILDAQSVSPDGRITFLADQSAPGSHSQVLLRVVDQKQDDPTSLTLNGAASKNEGFLSKLFSSADRTPRPYRLASGPSGEVWIAGATNSYLDLDSANHSDDYVAKVDATGKPIWEMAYGHGGRRNVWDIASLPDGDVAVVGRQSWSGRVARIGRDGTQLWERSLGSDLGAALAALPGGRLAVAGFETEGSPQKQDFRSHVTLWLLDGTGAILAQTRVRASISNTPYNYFGRVSLIATEDAIYVSSGWSGTFDFTPTEIAKIDLEGRLLWTTLLPDTVAAAKSMPGRRTDCSPAFTADQSGKVVVACALNGRIQIYEIDSASGASQESSLPLPDCHTGHPAALFLVALKDGTMILSGSRPRSNVAASCSWIGLLSARSNN